MILANLLRTMPHTALVAVGSYALIFRSWPAGLLQVGLLLSELLNAGLKLTLRKLAGPGSQLLRRPKGAADSGIYPQHFPQASTSSGMPSGHSQTSTFLATIFSHEVLRQLRCDDNIGNAEGCSQPDFVSPSVAIPLCYIWLVACLVMVSRTDLVPVLSVHVDGRVVAHHTILQVVVGGALGASLGHAAVEWYDGRSWIWWALLPILVLLPVAAAALLETARRQPDRASDSEQGETDIDSDKSTEEGCSDLSISESTSAASEIELPMRHGSRHRGEYDVLHR